MNNTQQIFLTEIIDFQSDNQIFTFTTKEGELKVNVFAEDIFQIRAKKNNQEWDNFSYSVVGGRNKVAIDIKKENEYYSIKTHSLTLKVQKNPLRLSFYNNDNELINEDDFGISWYGEEVTTYKKLQENEKFIGLGEKNGNLNRRGNYYVNWNSDAFAYSPDADPLYASIPFFMGLRPDKMYGIFFDNTYKSIFNFGAASHRHSYFKALGGEMKYYFIYGKKISNIIEKYTFLTGRIALPPIWSLGFQQCRYSYYPESEILNLADTFRTKDIPCDVLYFDIHYMEKYKVFTWDKKHFPNPEKTLKKLKQKGFQSVVILDPGIKKEENYLPYEDGKKTDIFVKYPDGELYEGGVWPGICHFPDFTNPKARVWWGDYFEELIKIGLTGFWNDMNEPAVWGKDFPDITEFDYDNHPTTHRKAHNIYGMQMARATNEGAKKFAPNLRPFVLTRAGFSGIQRYAAVWTGDNVSEDRNMLNDVRLLNSMGLSGLAFSGADVGGFVGECTKEVFNKWIAIGAFSPFFRCHTMINSRDAEPWSFGEETEEIARNYIKLRYKLLPYLYSTFFEATQNGMPIQRSLAFYYPFDEKIYQGNYQNQYFFGQSLMVCAVSSEREIHKLYLPKGNWFDLFNDTMYEGEQEIFMEIKNDKLPIFVKGGQLLITHNAISNTSQKPSKTLEVHIYRGKNIDNQAFVYYEDDGLTTNHEEKEFYRRCFWYDDENKSIEIGEVQGNYNTHFEKMRIFWHGFEKKHQHKTTNYNFVLPISNFDPWEYPEDLSKTIKKLPYQDIILKSEKMTIAFASI
ncbi:MAG: DUF4968 domain-containing protein [Cytophagia bacterium]|nr:MAG: DUF4968 domain-containing protein [Cytophagia bacterium]